MKVDFDAVLKDLNGEPIKQDAAEGSPIATLKNVALMALQAGHDPRQPDDAAKKLRCFQVMVKANAGGVQDVTAEDVALIKEKIGIVYPPLVVGVSYQLLEG